MTKKKHVETERRWAVVFGEPPNFAWAWPDIYQAGHLTLLFPTRAHARRYVRDEGVRGGRAVRVKVTVREI